MRAARFTVWVCTSTTAAVSILFLPIHCISALGGRLLNQGIIQHQPWHRFVHTTIVVFVVAYTDLIDVMVSPLPCSGVMICTKCPLIIPGRRYRLPGGVVLSPLRSEGIRRAKQPIEETTTSLQTPVKHQVCVSDLSRARNTPAPQ